MNTTATPFTIALGLRGQVIRAMGRLEPKDVVTFISPALAAVYVCHLTGMTGKEAMELVDRGSFDLMGTNTFVCREWTGLYSYSVQRPRVTV